MIARTLRNGLCATVAVGSLMVGFSMSPAAANPLPFQVDPSVLATGGPYPTFTATDINGTSDAQIVQTGPTSQSETGWLQIQSFTNNGALVSGPTSRLDVTGGFNSGSSTVYGMYITFQGTVTGITGSGAGQTGTVAPGGYTFSLYADPMAQDQFNSGVTGPSPTPPSVTDVGSNDILLAVGSSVTGSVGFAPSTGAPFFDVLASFVLCNGTPGQGVQGGALVSAPTCGTFDATKYFVSPNPFYAFDFNSSISGSVNNLTSIYQTPTAFNANLNGVVADINFVPEPASLSIFGAALALLAAFSWRRKKNSAAV